jgi:hypothetical protein
MALTAGLPSPSDPSIVAFGAVLGAFFMSTKARRRHDDREEWGMQRSRELLRHGHRACYLPVRQCPVGKYSLSMPRSWTIPTAIAFAILIPLLVVAHAFHWSSTAVNGPSTLILLGAIWLHARMWEEEEGIRLRRDSVPPKDPGSSR